MRRLPDVVVVGPPVAGKGMVSKVLLECGFGPVIDTGSLVRAELAQLGETAPERNRQGDYATKMIREFGGGYFVDKWLKSDQGPYIIDGPRRQVEIDYLIDRGAVLVFVDAPIDWRHVWSSARDSERDGLTRASFGDKDMLEWGYKADPNLGFIEHNDPQERNLRHARGQAHAILYNTGRRETLERFIRECVGHIREGEVGPGSGWGQRVYGRPLPIMARL